MSSDQADFQTLRQSLKRMPGVYDFLADIAERVDQFPLLFEIIRTDPGVIKYHCEKILRLCSEKNPALIYPFFNDVAEMLTSSNNFIKWGAITIMANLAAVDDRARLCEIYDKYFSFLDDPSMISAAHVIDGAWKLIRRYPEWEPDITARLLEVQHKIYLNKKRPSPACRDILYGNLLDCFGNYFPISNCQANILEFVGNLQNNPRKSIVRRAARFLERFGPA